MAVSLCVRVGAFRPNFIFIYICSVLDIERSRQEDALAARLAGEPQSACWIVANSASASSFLAATHHFDLPPARKAKKSSAKQASAAYGGDEGGISIGDSKGFDM